MNRKLFLRLILSFPFGYRAFRAYQGKYNRKSYLLNNFYVAGFQYYEGKAVLKAIGQGTELRLAPEPGNEHDEFAVEVFYKNTKLGYIPRYNNRHVFRLLQQGASVSCKVTGLNPAGSSWEKIEVEIWLNAPSVSETSQ